MVISFHPCFVGDVNRLCAGRDPGPEDRAAIRAADAVILPQGCRRPLYEMARRHGRRVFPNYDARFAYPGKTGQIRLFRRFEAAHPESLLFSDLQECRTAFARRPAMAFPLVFKFDWGGEGAGVFRFDQPDAFCRFLAARCAEAPSPCLVQTFVPGGRRTLRVAVIGRSIRSYWRTAPASGAFHANLARGGVIDADSAPNLQAAGRSAVQEFCKKCGIDLAGFDLVFSDGPAQKTPLFLEINYTFGRRGLGGSERFYRLLEEQIRIWLGEGGRR